MADSGKDDETLDALQSSSGRAIRPTEAGREYQTQLKTKAYKHQLRELKQLSRQVVRQSGTEVELNPDISEEKAKKWIHNYISFSQTEYELCHLLPRAEVEQHSENHKMVLEEIDQLLPKYIVNRWERVVDEALYEPRLGSSARKELVGLSCDVQRMFNQVGVNPEDRNLLRFLWWKRGDITASPEEHRMTTHLFGATSSPACAMMAWKETANRYESTSGRSAAEFVRRNFYVDDGLTSVPDVESAVDLAKRTIDLCAKGGFNLRKFASNESEVLLQLPANRRAKDLQEVEVMNWS
ncbi:uncharacterized protein LOC122380835 [Amphibalanus amphitrite]|uniref:uncharacterized protein LOC122380835 n=1 Tax=Amphibalanus amphitrite TaxID=1232801 RepID=UPI001C926BE5|nr:uncharacterized protein LOC122380835 [Amphibalanus amphitrite]